jgi:hypothetical protein
VALQFQYQLPPTRNTTIMMQPARLLGGSSSARPPPAQQQQQQRQSRQPQTSLRTATIAHAKGKGKGGPQRNEGLYFGYKQVEPAAEPTRGEWRRPQPRRQQSAPVWSRPHRLACVALRAHLLSGHNHHTHVLQTRSGRSRSLAGCSARAGAFNSTST